MPGKPKLDWQWRESIDVPLERNQQATDKNTAKHPSADNDKVTADGCSTLPPFDARHFSHEMVADLRSDHAGETGAVYIYKGVLACATDTEVVAFAREHLETEQHHLAFFNHWLPHQHHSRLIGAWKVAGFILGAVSTLFGKSTLYNTIDAVETFVVQHYQQQLAVLNRSTRVADQQLSKVLQQFQSDEAHHRDDAARRRSGVSGLAGAWYRLVELGSAWAVAAARRW